MVVLERVHPSVLKDIVEQMTIKAQAIVLILAGTPWNDPLIEE